MVDPRLGKASPPFVHIERLVLDGTAQELGKSLEVLPGQGYLENHYTGLSLGKPEQVRFSYQMSGQQQTWQDVGTRRTIYFPQLPPGTYRFSVRALSPDGVWSEQAAAVNIVVKPHFWQTSWYQLLVLGGLAGGLALAYRQREAWYQRRAARQEAFARELINSQERERQRIAGELHDGLGQSLAIIKQRALQSPTRPDDNELLVEQLQEIAKASTEALNEMRQAVFDLRPGNWIGWGCRARWKTCWNACTRSTDGKLRSNLMM